METGLYSHLQKIGIWCTVSHVRVAEPSFFTKTISAERYQRITELLLVSLEPEMLLLITEDGDMAHTTGSSTMQFLNEFFGDYHFITTVATM